MDGHLGTGRALDAAQGGEPGGIACVKRCVDVPSLETGVAGLEVFLREWQVVPVVGQRLLDGPVEDAVVVFSLVPFAYDADVLGAGDREDITATLDEVPQLGLVLLF